jgi:hypothetical protein
MRVSWFMDVWRKLENGKYSCSLRLSQAGLLVVILQKYMNQTRAVRQLHAVFHHTKFLTKLLTQQLHYSSSMFDVDSVYRAGQVG